MATDQKAFHELIIGIEKGQKEEILLEKAGITDDDLAQLLQAMTKSPNRPHTLNLKENHLTGKSLTLLADFLKTDKSLTTVYIDKNIGIHAIELRHLVSPLSQNTSMRAISWEGIDGGFYSITAEKAGVDPTKMNYYCSAYFEDNIKTYTKQIQESIQRNQERARRFLTPLLEVFLANVHIPTILDYEQGAVVPLKMDTDLPDDRGPSLNHVPSRFLAS